MYTFRARHAGDIWVLDCAEEPHVQTTARRLTGAHLAARAALTEHGLTVDDDDDVVITTELPARAEGHLATARDLDEQMRELAARIEDELASGVQLLREAGLSQREISAALGLPVSRVRHLIEHEVEEDVPLTTNMMEVLYETGALRRPPTWS